MEYILKEEKPAGQMLIAFGYALALLGGMIGLLIGNHILTSYVSANGEAFYKFDARSRLHAKIIMVLSLTIIIFGLFLNLALKI